MKSVVDVSHEMVTFVGMGDAPEHPLPDRPVVFRVGGIGSTSRPLLSFDNRYARAVDNEWALVLVVSADACRRLFSTHPDAPATWHLPSELARLALSIIDCEIAGEPRTTLQLARSIELLCQIHAALADGSSLVEVAGEGPLSELDIARIATARRAIDQRWRDKLTIADLARVAGMNRDKLARGFQALYGATIAQVLTERRLSEARTMLLASDLPVATIGYRCSYLNNAAFSRAFNRHFGVAPSELRRVGLAA